MCVITRDKLTKNRLKEILCEVVSKAEIEIFHFSKIISFHNNTETEDEYLIKYINTIFENDFLKELEDIDSALKDNMKKFSELEEKIEDLKKRKTKYLETLTDEQRLIYEVGDK